jgi:multimeric flavodoxin WrbA
MAKKIIGMTCGKKNGNSEIFLKAALKGAEEFGVESEIIRVMDLKVLPCKGCWACNKAGKCVYKDDVDWILEKTILGDSGLIVAAPVYHVRSNGMLMCIAEKMNHVWRKDLSTLDSQRMGGIISVAGSGYDGWSSLGLPSVNLFMQHIRLLVDQVQINHVAQKSSALTPDNRWAIERCKQLGRNVAKAMGMPPSEVKFMGEKPPISCPVCFCNILYVENDLSDVACPVCGVHGKVVGNNGKFGIEWNMEQAKQPRFSRANEKHHTEWMAAHHKEEFAQLELPETKQLIKEYEAYGKFIEPDKTE